MQQRTVHHVLPYIKQTAWNTADPMSVEGGQAMHDLLMPFPGLTLCIQRLSSAGMPGRFSSGLQSTSTCKHWEFQWISKAGNSSELHLLMKQGSCGTVCHLWEGRAEEAHISEHRRPWLPDIQGQEFHFLGITLAYTKDQIFRAVSQRAFVGYKKSSQSPIEEKKTFLA